MSKYKIVQFWPDRFTLALAALAVLGTVLILAREVNYGANIVGDSIHYISIARNLLAGNGYTSSIIGSPPWPPLYPLLLTFFAIFGSSPADIAGMTGYLNAIAFGLTIFVFAIWLRARVRSRFLVVWACLACVLSMPLVDVSASTRSEALFILFTVISFFAVNKFLDTDKRSCLIWAAIFTGLACLVRYIGVTIVPSVLLLLLLRRDATFLKKVKNASVYSIIAMVPICVWMLRNILVIGSLTGHGVGFGSWTGHLIESGEYELLFNFRSALSVVAEWVFIRPGQMVIWFERIFGVEMTGEIASVVDTALPVLVAVVLVMGIGAGVIGWHRQRFPHDSRLLVFLAVFVGIYVVVLTIGVTVQDVELVDDRYFAPAYIPLVFIVVLPVLVAVVLVMGIGADVIGWRRQRFSHDSRLLILLIVFVGIYVVVVTIGVTIQGIETVTHRYLAPLYIPLLFSAILVLDKLFRYDVKSKPWGSVRFVLKTDYMFTLGRVTVVLMVGLLLWLWCHAASYKDGFQYHLDHGGGVHSREWRDSEVIRYIKDHMPTGQIIWSTGPWQLYFYEVQAMQNRRIWSASANAMARWVHRSQATGDDDVDVYVVWFYALRPHSYSLSHFTFFLDVELVAELSDGVIFRVTENAVSQADAHHQEYESIVSTAPILRSNFDVYRRENSITYVKNPCSLPDTEARFFLHIVPTNSNDLPDDRKQYGFDNHGFSFDRPHGMRFDGKCMVSVGLPGYRIERMVTGQYIPQERRGVWVGEIQLPVNENAMSKADAHHQEYESGMSASPVLRAYFDVYRRKNSITYVKNPCSQPDIQARFFLHIYPRDLQDLPDDRKQQGFDNLDFSFYEHVVRFDGKCMATVGLPAYSIERIVTGQFVPGQGKLWEDEFSVDELPQ